MSSARCRLRVDAVHVWRGDRHVLRDLSFEVRDAELLHVVGRNGTGKTTLLRTVAGLVTPEQGEVWWFDRSTQRRRDEFHSVISYLAHEPALKADLTALENLRFAIAPRRPISMQEAQELLGMAGASKLAHLPVKVLSAGQKRRLALARAVGARSALWLLDEPFSNLDADGVGWVNSLLRDHRARGGAAIVVAHEERLAQDDVRGLELSE